MINRSERIYDAIAAGANNYFKLAEALPDIPDSKIKSGISYLKLAGYINKTGMSSKSKFAIIPENPYKAYERKPQLPPSDDETEIPAAASIPLPATDKSDVSKADSAVIAMPDFNQMFLDMVEMLGDQIAIKAKEHAYTLLNTPEFSKQLAEDMMARFSMPVVVFSGPDTTTLTFNTPPAAHAAVPVGVSMNVVEQFTQPEPTPVVKVDPSLMQVPKEPEVKVERTRLPRVCVSGMKPVEAGAISKEFAETFDLIFWNDRNGDGVEQLRAHSKNCEALFWHVKHGSHSNESIARDGTAKFFRVNGDLTQMRKKLREYFYELKQTQSAASE